MDKKNTGHASNSKVTAMIMMIQKFMREEAKLKKQIEAANRRGEEQKAKVKNFDPKLAPMMNCAFEGRGCEELESYHDQLVEMQRMVADLQNK
ncbi:hypothetical protein HU200_018872 [Digitaria exilis]|uniref:Uncharacterized protein n=1 Tax=Digitaria exilis TaxID=1010633 RepID=A0A835F457_9POAL|nr:hypothetical protein HU200_018872 [Digitaria exilis]CAB3499996.1 unnamed protein product [Digitaria exilis]